MKINFYFLYLLRRENYRSKAPSYKSFRIYGGRLKKMQDIQHQHHFTIKTLCGSIASCWERAVGTTTIASIVSLFPTFIHFVGHGSSGSFPLHTA